MSRFTDLFQPKPVPVVEEPAKNEVVITVVEEPAKNEVIIKPTDKVVDMDKWKGGKNNK